MWSTVRLTLFHNPSAGHGRHDADELEQILRTSGHAVTMQSVDQPDWERALEQPGELVVVAGGDGTVASISIKMIGRPQPIAVIPMGTANNVARAIGLGLGTSPREIVRAWEHSQPCGFDIGLAESEGRTQHFLECVGVGEFGRLIVHRDLVEGSALADDRERKLERDLEVLAERVATGNGQAVQLYVDGVDRSGEYLLAEVLNTWSFGPRLGLAPQAAVGDGRLHVVLVGHDQRAELVRYLERLRDGDATPPALEVVAADRVELSCAVDDLHVDGDLWTGEGPLVDPKERVTVRASLLHGAVRFLRPGPCP